VRLRNVIVPFLGCSVLVVSEAWAQPVSGHTGTVPSGLRKKTRVEAGAGPTEAPPAIVGENDPAAAIFDRAIAALARGQKSEAIKLFERLRAEYPTHPLASRAEAGLQAVDLALAEPAGQIGGSGPPPRVDQSQASERATRQAREQRETTATARAELVFFQTLHGIGLGAEACLIAGCEDSQPWVLSLMVGAGAGVGLSLHFSSDGVTPGLARSLTSGTEWGLYNGLMLGLATRAFERADEGQRAVALGLGLGQLVGLGAGGLLYSAFKPTAGQVSLASSGGIWTTVTVMLGLVLLSPDIEDERVVFSTALIASDLGLLGGSFLARYQPMSASRVLLIDAGAIVGLLGGVGMAVLGGGDDVAPELVGGLGLLGTATGLALSYYFTRNWDGAEGENSDVSIGILPVAHGAMASALLRF
jgi:hypothetical protein